jgi:hypothetical protein
MDKKLLQSVAKFVFFTKVKQKYWSMPKLEPFTSICPTIFVLTPSFHGHVITSETTGQFPVKSVAKQRGHMVYRLARCYRFL